MVNKTGGKKHKKYKKNRDTDVKKKIIFKEDGEEYGLVIKRLGGPILSLKLFDDRKVLGVIRGKMRKRVWINEGDIILVSLRGFQDNKVDVILKYSDEEVRKLIKGGKITKSFVMNKNDDENDMIIYDEEESDDGEDEDKKYTDKVSYKNDRTKKMNFDWDAI